MCLFKVKEEEEYPVARVKRVTRVRRYESSPPPERLERSSYHREERRAPPSTAPSTVPPPPSTHRAETVRSRRTSRAPSARAPSVRSTTRSHYVEVEEDEESSTGSSEVSSEDVRSRATSHRTRKTAKSVAPPLSEYSVHEREKEIRRERIVPKPEFETYRYVNAPPEKENYRRERENITIEDGYGRRDRDSRR